MSHSSLLGSPRGGAGIGRPAPGSGVRSALAPARPGRVPTHVLAAVGVVAAVGAVFAGTLWDTVRPVKSVTVHPAVPLVVSVDDGVAEESSGARADPGSGGDGGEALAPGWLEAEPFAVAAAALADGVVSEILVLEGERVDRGRPLAKLVDDDAKLEVARAEADAAVAAAALVAADADLAAAQSEWDHPIERTRAVETSRAELAETAAELAQLPSLVAAEEATLDRLREELTRGEEALVRGAATDIEVIILRRRVESQAASLEALRARESILSARRDRLASELTAAERNASLRIEETRALASAKAARDRAAAEMDQAGARLAEARLRLSRMTVVAPITGAVQRRFKSPGDKIMVGMDDPTSAQIALLYDPSRLQVRVDVPLADAAKIVVGQACEVTVDVLPDRAFGGRVLRITNEADLQKNTLQVKVKVVDPSPLLKPEMLTRVKFLAGGAPRAGSEADRGGRRASGDAGVRIRWSCLDGESRVWVVRDRRGSRGVASAVPIEIGRREGDYVAAIGGLHPGDLVIDQPAALREGQRVAIRPEPVEIGDHR